jgi:hypothetical protein
MDSYENTSADTQNQQLTEGRFSGQPYTGIHFVPPFSSPWVSGPPLIDVSFYTREEDAGYSRDPEDMDPKNRRA